MKRKSLVMSIIAVFVVVTALFVFAACDEKSGSTDESNDKNIFIFKAGTTADDIIDMVDKGEIVSYKLKFSDTESEAADIYYVSNRSRIVNSKSCEYSYWSAEIIENDYAYLLEYDFEGIQADKFRISNDEYVDKVVEMKGFSLSTLMIYLNKYYGDNDNEVIIKDFKVNKGTVTWKYESHGSVVKMELSEINGEAIVLPDELKNYKEIAVERTMD